MTETPETYDHAAALDGNVLAGSMLELFAVDVTAATTCCVGCSRVGVVAGLRVFGSEAGYVARCPDCDSVVLRIVSTPRAIILDLRGTVRLEVPRPPE